MNASFPYALKLILVFSFLGLGMGCQTSSRKNSSTEATSGQDPKLLTETRQLTFGGKRSGEGYFSPNGQLMVFQSEREKENPFYQIYLMNLASGETKRVSTGTGKTTCAWIHPTETKVLYASTHLDPQAIAKQKQELEERASGQQKRYAWDYDETYDLFEASPSGKVLKRLTKERGYDAEGSYSPDGQWIAFASNRHAYLVDTNEALKTKMQKDPSVGMEIYIMKADGTQVKRLTNHEGYDGGPFFSPDGRRITWRRFTPDGMTAEIYTMNVDGSDQKQITRLNAMSWAPFYHPSGDYLIFTTNLLGYQNFELYMVDLNGQKDPVRVTYLEGFDGLPVFTPDGKNLTWSRRDPAGESQIYVGKWDDEKARILLGLPKSKFESRQLAPEIRIADAQAWVQYLASPEMKGRATGTPEEATYQQTLVEAFQSMGLKPGAPDGSWYQKFDFVKAVKAPADKNSLKLASDGAAIPVGKGWTPLASSGIGEFKGEDLVFVGYGLVAPAENGMAAYDSYQEGKDPVEGQWFVVLRDIPGDVDAKTRAHYFRYARADHKVMLAEKRGARGVIFVTGPRSQVPSELMELSYDRASGQSSIPVLSMTRETLAQLLEGADLSQLKSLQEKLDKGQSVSIQRWQSKPFSFQITLEKEVAQGSNLIAALDVVPGEQHIMIGAHGDHLGIGKSSSSLMQSGSNSEIHHGADDNASGMAGVMEAAHYLVDRVNSKKIKLRQNLKFAIWSGEELGNLGSTRYVKTLGPKKSAKISAYVNMDMIGRLDSFLSVQGVGSSPEWEGVLERMSTEMALAIKPQSDPYLPTDSMSFYLGGVPILNFFTGAHTEYHTPQDTPEKINYKGLVATAEYVARLTEKLGAKATGLKYQKIEQKGGQQRGGFRLFLGTIPDYSQEGVKGVRVQGVIKGGPAEQAGLKSGDVIVQFSEHKVQSLYDYVYTLQVVKPGEATTITVVRDGKEVQLPITPALKK
jgi:Tol biopolymer transport system component